jgi:hypothetical protein
MGAETITSTISGHQCGKITRAVGTVTIQVSSTAQQQKSGVTREGDFGIVCNVLFLKGDGA